jgi:hypothetical protein
MTKTKKIVVGVALVALVGGGVAYWRYQKKKGPSGVTAQSPVPIPGAKGNLAGGPAYRAPTGQVLPPTTLRQALGSTARIAREGATGAVARLSSDLVKRASNAVA